MDIRHCRRGRSGGPLGGSGDLTIDSEALTYTAKPWKGGGVRRIAWNDLERVSLAHARGSSKMVLMVWYRVGHGTPAKRYPEKSLPGWERAEIICRPGEATRWLGGRTRTRARLDTSLSWFAGDLPRPLMPQEFRSRKANP